MPKSRIFNLGCGVIALATTAFTPAFAADFTLSFKNSSIEINTNASAGASNWKVDGVNYLNYHWFYYRVGSAGGEAPIQNIGTSTATLSHIPNIISSLDLTYANSSYSVRTLFDLTGGNFGSGSASLSESITVRNLSGSSLDFHFFQYSDFNIWGLAGGQTVQFSPNLATGGYNTVAQTDGFRVVTENVGDFITPIGRFEANLANITLSSLTDSSPTTLANTQTAGLGDVTFAYQWDVVLAPGGSFQLSKLLSIVPEPTTASLMFLSAMAFGLTRRQPKI